MVLKFFAPVEKNIEFVNKYSIFRFCPHQINGSNTKDITLERHWLRSNLAKWHEKKSILIQYLHSAIFDLFYQLWYKIAKFGWNFYKWTKSVFFM